nr:MotA/TolQ/ExbB proton channel family protein [Litoribacterium kuwaitense]
MLTVDGVEPNDMKDILTSEIIALENRHAKHRQLLEKAGAYAPAWGMIGTLIGLVLMLRDLNDPSTLGPSMAVALITTLYGTLMANLLFLPMAAKLKAKTDEEVFYKLVAIEAVIGIQSGQNPTLLKDKLSSFVPSEPINAPKEKTSMSSGDLFNETS